MPVPAEAETVAATGVWVDMAATTTAALTERTQVVASGLWAGFTGWYEPAAVAAVSTQAAEVSTAAQNAVSGAMAEYIGQVVAYLRGTAGITIPRVSVPTIRNGVDLTTVHARTADTYRMTYAVTEDVTESIERAFARELELIEADLALAAREAQDAAMVALEVETYRRVLRPELSQTGPCGLCVAASTQVYRVGDLLPLHGRCKCKTVPIVGALDPAEAMNSIDLKALYAAAGSTTPADLKRVRYEVNEHGELGPVLTVKGQRFTGPGDLDFDKDVERARRQLASLEPVLTSLERRAAAGEDVSGPLTYQRALVARLRTVAAAH